MKLLVISVFCMTVLGSATKTTLNTDDFKNAEQLLKDRVHSTAHSVAADGEYTEGLTEGDIVEEHIRERGMTANPNRKWTGGRVPYVIDSAYDDAQRAVLAAAFLEFATKTCIQFVEANPDDLQYLDIADHSQGCSSVLGRSVHNAPQNLSLTSSCFSLGTVEHELMHAIGFLHEQSRSDRDSFVQINWEFVPVDRINNFIKINDSVQDSPYDYGSVMHYRPGAFSNTTGEDTITPLLDTEGLVLGQRDGMDDIDVQEINAYYECPTTQAPTTQAPTTPAPTTQAPTTQAPTTQAPTTQAPTTQAPTTQAPTTQAPTTQAPTTQAPTTQAPTTQAPTTQAPTTQAPTTQAPTTQAPTTQAPTTQAPNTQAPTTQAPNTQAPTTQSPSVFTTRPKYSCPVCRYVNVYLHRCTNDPAWMAEWCSHCDPVAFPEAYCTASTTIAPTTTAPTTAAPSTTTRRVFTTRPKYSCGVCNYIAKFRNYCVDEAEFMVEWCSYCDPVAYPAAHCIL